MHECMTRGDGIKVVRKDYANREVIHSPHIGECAGQSNKRRDQLDASPEGVKQTRTSFLHILQTLSARNIHRTGALLKRARFD